MDGTALLYLVSQRYDHGVGDHLYHYDCLTGVTTLVSTDAGRLFTLSPDGKSISYTTFYTPNDPEATTCYIQTLGEDPSVLDTDCFCISISNNADTVYYMKIVDDKDCLLVRHEGQTTLLSETPRHFEFYWEHAYNYFLNVDLTQIVFSTSDASYFSMSGCDPVKIGDEGLVHGEIWELSGKKEASSLPDHMLITLNDAARSFAPITIIGKRNLCHTPFFTRNEHYLIFDENMIVTTGARNSFHQNTYSVVSNMPPSIDFELTEDQVAFYLPESSLDSFELYAMNAQSENRLIASQVISIYLLEKEGPDILYYLALPDGYEQMVEEDINMSPFLDLYAVEETSETVPTLIAEKVCNVYTGDFGLIYHQYKEPAPHKDYGETGVYTATVKIIHIKNGEEPSYIGDRLFEQYYGS